MSHHANARHYATNSCWTGKRAFTDRASAKAAAKNAARSGLGHMRPYLCDGCDRWHFGHLSAAVLAGVA